MAFTRATSKASRMRANMRRRTNRQPSQKLEHELGISTAQKIPKPVMMPKGKIEGLKPAISKKKRLRPLLGYL